MAAVTKAMACKGWGRGGMLVCWSCTAILDIAGPDYGPWANICAHTKAGSLTRPRTTDGTPRPCRAVPSVEWPECRYHPDRCEVAVERGGPPTVLRL